MDITIKLRRQLTCEWFEPLLLPRLMENCLPWAVEQQDFVEVAIELC